MKVIQLKDAIVVKYRVFSEWFKFNNKYFILAIFLTFPILVLNRLDHTSLMSYNAVLVSISITIATFSISFSFLQYQFSPYKSLLKRISKRHLFLSFVTIFLSLVPLFCLFYRRDLVPGTSLIVIPTLAYLVILLIIVSKEESDPVYIIKKLTRKNSLARFRKNFIISSERYILSQKGLEFSKPNESPMHDYSESKYHPVQIANDPFRAIGNVIDIALSNTDLETFEEAVDMFFEILGSQIAILNGVESDTRFKFFSLFEFTFNRIANSISKKSPNETYQNRFLEKVSHYLKIGALSYKQVSPVNSEIGRVLAEFAKEILPRNRNGALFITSLFRQLAQKGIYDNPKEDASFMFDLHLPQFASHIKTIGSEAINLKDSDTLFRCLEELGYLGCSSVKSNHRNVGIECIAALVQLGRMARANDIKCFWRHCLLDSIDHAEERLTWMVTWLSAVEEQARNQWLESFTEAYSRLTGYETTVNWVREGEKYGYSINKTKTPHVLTFMDREYTREIDYSNFKDIKEFKLY